MSRPSPATPLRDLHMALPRTIVLSQGAFFLAHSLSSHLLSGLPHVPRDRLPPVLHGGLPWLSAVQIFLLVTSLVLVVQKLLLPHAVRAALCTDTELDDKAVDIMQSELNPDGTSISSKLARLTHLLLILFLASTPLRQQIPFLARKEIADALTFLVAWRALTVFWRFLTLLVGDALPDTEFARRQSLDRSSVNTLLRIVRPLYWSLGVLLIGENSGLKIGSLVASAGVGGVAIALSAQQILQDIIAAVTMLLDQTVRQGDYVMVSDDISGTVISRGWKSTRLLSPKGHVNVLANRDICSTRIKSFAPRQNRMEAISLRLDMKTDLSKLEHLSESLQKAVETTDATFKAAHLKKFEICAILFEVIVMFEDCTLGEYWARLHKVNVVLAKTLDAEKLKFAVPYRNVT